MTRSSTKELFSPLENPEQKFRLRRRLFDTLVMDIKEKDKIKAKTEQNQAGNGKRGKVNQVKAKVEVKPVKTGHGFRKSTKNQSQRRKYLIEPSLNPSLDIQNELSHHELFINELVQKKLQNEYAQPFSAIAITFDLPTVEPEDSLRMGDEHLDTIPKTESNEFIQSSVKNLVPNPSESEDLFDSECAVPACVDFTTFSNLLFDADDDFSSNDSMPPGIEEDGYDSERDILILEELLSHDSLSLPKNESFHFDIPSSLRPPAKPSDDDEIKPNLEILTVKMVGDIFEYYVPMPRLLPTQPTLVSNQEKSPHLLSHRGFKAS
nr:hypothetical protein [Tanacetum cinerariifolium]